MLRQYIKLLHKEKYKEVSLKNIIGRYIFQKLMPMPDVDV